MDSVLYPLFALMSQWMRPRFNVRMQLLEAQLRTMRSRVDTILIVPTPEEWATVESGLVASSESTIATRHNPRSESLENVTGEQQLPVEDFTRLLQPGSVHAIAHRATP